MTDKDTVSGLVEDLKETILEEGDLPWWEVLKIKYDMNIDEEDRNL